MSNFEQSPDNLSFYTFSFGEKLSALLKSIDEINDEINLKRPLEGDLWRTIEEKLRLEWTFNSNAIEGSTLTLGETLFFLQNGLTVEGKPFKDFLDAKNHAEAIEFLYDIVKNDRQITPGLLKEFNALLLSGVKKTPAIDQFGRLTEKDTNPGSFKQSPNTVLQPDGTIHRYTDPLQVPAEIEMLCTWINEETDRLHPVTIAAVAHYNFVRIHPFDDGNGRGARLLMNLILIKNKIPPAIIKNEDRRKYIELLADADSGKLNPFIEFIAESCLNTLRSILANLK